MTKKGTYSCPVCKSKKTGSELMASNTHGATIYNNEKKFEYYRCDNCSALFLVGVTANKKYYETYYNTDYREEKTENTLASFIVSNSNTIKKNLVQKYTIPGSHRTRILDIGSGTGTFLSMLEDAVYEKWGLEIEKKLTKSYKNLGINSITRDILSHDFGKQKFDCITMWHVIEHIKDPQALLSKVRKLLAKDGICMFSTPNTKCLAFEKGKEQWFHLDAPRHFVLYDLNALSMLAKNYRFEIIETRNNWHDFPMDLFWSLKNNPQKFFYYLLYPFFKFRDQETVTCVWRKVS